MWWASSVIWHDKGNRRFVLDKLDKMANRDELDGTVDCDWRDEIDERRRRDWRVERGRRIEGVSHFWYVKVNFVHLYLIFDI